jgi:hypothetical protein
VIWFGYIARLSQWEDGGILIVQMISISAFHGASGGEGCQHQCCGSGSVGSVCVLGLLDLDPDNISMRYGSGSGSGSFYDQEKTIRKPLIPTVL